MGNLYTILKITGLVLFGVCAAIAALWLESHRSAILEWGYIVAVLMGCFFVCLTWALLLTLRQRDLRNARLGSPQGMLSQYANVLPNSASADELITVYTLQPGHCYRVIQSFRDYYGNEFVAGERLTFQQRHFLPYEGGHTVMFAEKTMYLQEEVNSNVLDSFSRYLVGCAAE